MSNWWRGLRDRARCRLNGRPDIYLGQGIIYQPTFIVADDLREGSLIALALDQPMQELDGVYTVYPPERHPAAKVRVFIDFLASRFGPEPPWDRNVVADTGTKKRAMKSTAP